MCGMEMSLTNMANMEQSPSAILPHSWFSSSFHLLSLPHL